MSNRILDWVENVLSIRKKSAIFIQSGWYSTKIFYPWASQFGKISAGLEENCRFFANIIILASPIFYCSYFRTLCYIYVGYTGDPGLIPLRSGILGPVF